MSEFKFKLPDLGEGTVEAEIVEWHVEVGDTVAEGDVMVDVMTDKANVEVPAPVSGTVSHLGGHPGDIIAVGAVLVTIRTEGATAAPTPEKAAPRAAPKPATAPEAEQEHPEAPQAAPKDSDDSSQDETRSIPPTEGNPKQLRVATSPAIRRRAKEAGVNLADVAGTGPGGRILRRDLTAFLEARDTGTPAPQAHATETSDKSAHEDVKVIGLRRLIAQRMSQSSTEIPHFAYIEEVDITELEQLRQHLNEEYEQGLTPLPFLGIAIIRALAKFPQCNAHYDIENNTLRQFNGVHLGVATQTDQGLKVPVVHDADTMNLWQLADAIRQRANAARDGSAKTGDLTGSSITISSLGKLGGLAATPIINYPEVAILGINKAVKRPVVINDQIQVRTMMNISGSFDHRFIDGFDAASFVQAIKTGLERPASLWIPPPT